MIELRDVSVRAGRFLLDGVGLRIESGQYAVLMGRTGSGKTTLLECLCGLRPVDKGAILLGQKDVTRWPPGQREIGYVPQDLALFPTLRVRQQLEFALRLRRAAASEVRRRVDELGRLLRIEPLLDRRVQGLSGGEAQRVALGRALSFRPSVLLLDEPLSAVDAATRNELYEVLKAVRQATGVTTLHVTHNLEDAQALADRLLVLEQGRLEERPQGGGHPIQPRWETTTHES